MFCYRCGAQLTGTEKFCGHCGAPLEEALKSVGQDQTSPPQDQTPPAAEQPVHEPEPTPVEEQPVQQPTAQEPGPAPAQEPPIQEPGTPPGWGVPPTQPPQPGPVYAPGPDGPGNGQPSAPKGGKKKWLLPVVIVAALAVGIGGFLLYRNISTNQAYQQAVEQGRDALNRGSYAQAVEYYEQAWNLRGLENADRLALAEAYLAQDNRTAAARLLEEGPLQEGDEQYALYQKLYAMCILSPEVDDVDTDNFPVVTLKLDCDQPFPLELSEVGIREDGQDCEVQEVTQEDGQVEITYLTFDAEYSEEHRQPVLTFSVDGISMEREGDYYTPYFVPARLRLVSTDVSEYPVVRAYFQVVDDYSGETVEGLDSNAFRIMERVEGGEYLAREVKSVLPLEGNDGLKIDLVADKSDSITEYDMGKIKTVMTEFVQELDFALGDRAEVLAFDSIVQQMCYYTDDVGLLVNGINNMSTDGLTAFYDAVYDGVTNATLQGGARCVIAFTDGMDNRSRHTPEELIRYANTQQTPVYIIGVGNSVETSTLRHIAESTGGRYWYIDDLYDLEAIFQQIYDEQMDYYIVEYESDSAADSYATRDLQVKVSGQGYRGESELTVTPVRSIRDDGGVGGGHRYELFKESLTWEEASRRCQEMGGHLATITSQKEMDQITAMAEAQDVKYIWLGGYTSYDDAGNVFGHWVTGEAFNFQAWSANEPSRQDQDGTEEWYIMLWNIKAVGGWCWNDQRNDPVSAVPTMADGMGFVCEFEE